MIRVKGILYKKDYKENKNNDMQVAESEDLENIINHFRGYKLKMSITNKDGLDINALELCGPQMMILSNHNGISKHNRVLIVMVTSKASG